MHSLVAVRVGITLGLEGQLWNWNFWVKAANKQSPVPIFDIFKGEAVQEWIHSCTTGGSSKKGCAQVDINTALKNCIHTAGGPVQKLQNHKAVQLSQQHIVLASQNT